MPDKVTDSIHADINHDATLASSPCAMSVNPEYMGYASKKAIASALNDFLELKRAIILMRSLLANMPEVHAKSRNALRASGDLRPLIQEIIRLGASKSQGVNPVFAMALKAGGFPEKRELLQDAYEKGAVLLDAIVPRVMDDALYKRLIKIGASHAAELTRLRSMPCPP